MADFLDQKRSEIVKRLEELRPLMDEYERLKAAAAALDQVPGASAPAARASSRRSVTRRTTTRRSGGATATRRRRASTAGRPGRRKGTGSRTLQTLELVQAAPKGITIPELATKMGINQNYLYRVLPSLQKEGKVRKRGRTWLPR